MRTNHEDCDFPTFVLQRKLRFRTKLATKKLSFDQHFSPARNWASNFVSLNSRSSADISALCELPCENRAMIRAASILTIVALTMALAISNTVSAEKVTANAPCNIERGELENSLRRPDAANWAHLKGKVAIQVGDYTCAILYLKESIRITGPASPHSITSYILLASAYEKLGLNDKVEKMWGKLLENYSGNNDFHRLLRARVLIRLGKHFLRRNLEQKAEQVFLEVVEGPAEGHWRFEITREQAFRLLTKLYKAQANLLKALEMNEHLVETIEARPSPTAVDVEDLVTELEERIRILELMGRIEDANQQRKRIQNLLASPT